jgi:Spy/CpxP family protein refolding chaperone
MNKKILFSALLLATILASGSAFAQGWGRNGDDGYGRRCGRAGNGSGYRGEFGWIDAMKAELGLSEQQVKQIFDLGTQYREKSFENRNNLNKLDELRVEHRKAVENVLTKEQLEKYNKIQNDNGRCSWFGGCRGRR